MKKTRFFMFAVALIMLSALVTCSDSAALVDTATHSEICRDINGADLSVWRAAWC
ncbi:hypothetical protein [Clostridium sp. Marseille-Q7071]